MSSTAAPLTRTILSSSKPLPTTLRQIQKTSPKSVSKTSPNTSTSTPPSTLRPKPWQTTAPPQPTSYFRITLTRSSIGLPKKSSRVLKFLGLHKRTATVYHPVTSDIAGQIMKVKELVEVEETKETQSKREQRECRRPERGFVVEKEVV